MRLIRTDVLLTKHFLHTFLFFYFKPLWFAHFIYQPLIMYAPGLEIAKPAGEMLIFAKSLSLKGWL